MQPEVTERALGGEPLQVPAGGLRLDHQRECGSVGRDHQLVAESALQAKLLTNTMGAVHAVALGEAVIAVRKAGGNVVELGSILAFGFSPLWLLAAAADVTRGTRVYLDALVGELKAAGVLAREAEFASVFGVALVRDREPAHAR